MLRTIFGEVFAYLSTYNSIVPTYYMSTLRDGNHQIDPTDDHIYYKLRTSFHQSPYELEITVDFPGDYCGSRD